jgi:TolB-like protein
MKRTLSSLAALGATLFLLTAMACAPCKAPVTKPGEAEADPSQQETVVTSLAVQQKPVPQSRPYTPPTQSTEALLSEISREVAGKVYYELKEEGGKVITEHIAVVSAVPLADLKKETEFGRVMAEYLLTDLADRGLNVTELRLGKDITILPQTGEFIMSRNIGELTTQQQELRFVVASTFTNTRKTLIVQGRLVDLQTGLIKSSWRYNLPLNRELLGLFQMARQPHTIAIRGMRK